MNRGAVRLVEFARAGNDSRVVTLARPALEHDDE